MNYLHSLATGDCRIAQIQLYSIFPISCAQARSWVLSGSNINPQLLWEELFMDWLQVFRRRGG